MTGTVNEEIYIIVESPKKVVSFKLDVDIIAQIDEVWPQLGYQSRSQFLREAVLFYLQYVQRVLREELLGNDSGGLKTEDSGNIDEEVSIDDIVSELGELVKAVSAKQLSRSASEAGQHARATSG